MHGFNTFVDYVLYTKKLEYMIAFIFMGLFILFFKYLKTPEGINELKSALTRIGGFFVPQNRFYHMGHSWLKNEDDNLVAVGMDDFAQKLTGRINGVELPEVGENIIQGEKAWTLNVDSKTFEMLSPVNGEVMEINRKLFDSPDIINQSPYENGWILKVKPRKIKGDLRNLLSGEFAAKWMEKTAEELVSRLNPDLGIVMGDGGEVVSGMAKNIDKNNWEKIVKEYFLTEE